MLSPEQGLVALVSFCHTYFSICNSPFSVTSPLLELPIAQDVDLGRFLDVVNVPGFLGGHDAKVSQLVVQFCSEQLGFCLGCVHIVSERRPGGADLVRPEWFGQPRNEPEQLSVLGNDRGKRADRHAVR